MSCSAQPILYFGFAYLIPAVRGYRESRIPRPTAGTEGVSWSKEELVDYLTRRRFDFSAVYYKDREGKLPYVVLKFHRLGGSDSKGAFMNIHEHPTVDAARKEVQNKPANDGKGLSWGRFSLWGTDAAINEVHEQLEF